ncbi:MAG: putative SbcC [uncultured bacterium]|nr:MAG: putative SbcC [uncultured bacterium]
MIIESLELIGYRRLALNAINSLTFVPKEQIQLILGTNGSGKSSLIKELTPIPPDPSDYIRTGSKKIIINSHGNNYTLKSTFAPTTRHSFIKNDEELNPGGTVTVFKELVRQEFNLTNEIHELLTGFELFHSMSPARRREWFTRLSDTSYDYALMVYNRLRERSRDISGALKMAKKHIVAESAKVISEAEELKLREDIAMILKELNFLLERSAPLEKPISEYQHDETTKMVELTKLSNKLLRMRLVAPYGSHPYGVNPNRQLERNEWRELIKRGFESVDEFDNLLATITYDIAGKEALLNNDVNAHSKIAESIKILIKAGKDGIISLQHKLVSLREKRNKALAMRKFGIEGLDTVNASSSFEYVYDVLSAVAISIPENKDKRFSQTRLAELTAKELDIKNSKLTKTSELARLESKRIHLETHKANGSVDCPKCHHSWIPGYSDEQLAKLIQAICCKEEELNKINKEIESIENELIAIQEYSKLYRDFIKCIKSWPVLQPFWDYLLEGNYIIEAPRKLVSILDAFRIDLTHELEAKKIDDEIAEVVDLIKSAEQIGDTNLADQQSKLDDLSIKIEGLTSEVNKLQANHAAYSKYKKQLLEANELGRLIKDLMIDVKQTNDTMIEMVRRETLNHCIKQLQSSLALKETALNNAMVQKAIITDLNKQTDKLTVDDEAAKILVKQLSPTDGLIAEGLLGFIKNYVNQMNSLIKRIWSYPLQVQHCGISNTEMDYKFPLLVQNKSNIVPDVKLGSTGMREIIDLAFKVVAMRYLNIADSPLYLDEYGSALDETHRKTAMEGIKHLMDTQYFTQLFMVSHYSNVYGVFTNAETCVLCPANITVPTVYNKHITINKEE